MMEQFRDHLATPDLQLAGFQLWVHGREFQDSHDYEDANWLNVTAHCGAQGASVWSKGAIIQTVDMADFLSQIDVLYRSLSGVARLKPLEPELMLELTASSTGHVSLEVAITPDYANQRHTFLFELDQSYLPALIAELRTVLQRFPVRE